MLCNSSKRKDHSVTRDLIKAIVQWYNTRSDSEIFTDIQRYIRLSQERKKKITKKYTKRNQRTTTKNKQKKTQKTQSLK
jgi:uncharacterized membrane protein YheB (UPF0754 family)